MTPWQQRDPDGHTSPEAMRTGAVGRGRRKAGHVHWPTHRHRSQHTLWDQFFLVHLASEGMHGSVSTRPRAPAGQLLWPVPVGSGIPRAGLGSRASPGRCHLPVITRELQHPGHGPRDRQGMDSATQLEKRGHKCFSHICILLVGLFFSFWFKKKHGRLSGI